MFRRVLIALSLIASVAWGSAEPAEGAAAATCLRHEDVDGDGEAEIVLENQYVRIDILSGRAPAVPKVPMWRRLRREPRQTPPPKYTCRFVGPGWIGNVVFKPTGRSWLAQITSGNEVWRGIPEEFEQAVRIREITPGVWRCLKIGVGVCQGTGWCYRSSLSLIDPGQWETRFVEVAGGGRAVVFTQTVSAGDGYAYRYEKRLLLMPADTRLLVERTLTNTGTAKLSSTWYTHAFWGQGQEGRYDEDCWATVPLRAGVGGKTSLELDTEACLISNPAEANYWGALDGEFVGDAWFACGNHRRSEVFLTMLAEIPAFYRVWTWSPTYSLEPFRLIDMAPGAVERWAEVLACGVGLDRVDTHDGTAAYSASVRPGTEDTAATVTITAAPFCEIRNATLHLAIRRANGSREQVEETITAAGPTAPFSIRLDRMADGLPLQVQLGLDTGAEPSAVAALARTGWMTVRPAEIGSGR